MTQFSKRVRSLSIAVLMIALANIAISFAAGQKSVLSVQSDTFGPRAITPSLPDTPRPRGILPSLPDTPRP